MLALPGGRRRLANVRKLMRLGRDFEREYGPDLRGFLQMVAEREAGRAVDARESEAPLEGDGLDAIRLMTIHRAKGLEWHTVCVADLGRSPRPAHQILRVSTDGRLGLRLSRPGVPGRVSALDYDAIGAAEKREEEDEERRLFYVAMTRARERLILSGATRFDGWTGAANSNGGGPVAWIARALMPDLGRLIAEGGAVVGCGAGTVRLNIPDAESIHGAAARVAAPVGPTSDPPPLASPTPPLPLPAARSSAPAVTTLSYSSLGAYARCGYRFYAERVLHLPGAREPTGSAAPPIRSAAERGVLLHALLERLSFRRPVLPDSAAVQAAAAPAGLSTPTAQEAVELIATIERFATSPLRARLAGLIETRREERFAFALTDGPLITGVIDVIGREPGGLTLIVDYKSDRLEGTEPEALAGGGYVVQRLVYALAALHAGAERVEVVHCFLERPDQPAVAVYGAGQRPRLQAELETLAAGVLAGDFAVADVPHRGLCAGCPAEGGLCSWPTAMTQRAAADRLF
jgi:ATP-dependent exoDNAse (exonuclease V) beta subunit